MQPKQICDACEWVATCLRKGCIPIVEEPEIPKGGKEKMSETCGTSTIAISRAASNLLSHIGYEGIVPVERAFDQEAMNERKSFPSGIYLQSRSSPVPRGDKSP